MGRRVFYSFHYELDNWRASIVRNIGSIEGNRPATDNDWETVKKGGVKAIENWIAGQMSARTCTIVLAGSNTANRKWITHEIVQSWNNGLGVLVIHIHNLKDSSGNQSTKGRNPLEYIKHGPSGLKLSTIAKAYCPPYTNSKDVYDCIVTNIESWIEDAIEIRKKNQ